MVSHEVPPSGGVRLRLSRMNEELRVAKQQLSVKSQEVDQMKAELQHRGTA